jgi:hypothetical protein
MLHSRITIFNDTFFLIFTHHNMSMRDQTTTDSTHLLSQRKTDPGIGDKASCVFTALVSPLFVNYASTQWITKHHTW